MVRSRKPAWPNARSPSEPRTRLSTRHKAISIGIGSQGVSRADRRVAASGA